MHVLNDSVIFNPVFLARLVLYYIFPDRQEERCVALARCSTQLCNRASETNFYIYIRFFRGAPQGRRRAAGGAATEATGANGTPGTR